MKSLRQTALASALLLTGATTALAATDMAADKAASTAMGNDVKLVPASEVVGTQITTRDGTDAGQIEYLLIDSQSGQVRAALVSGADGLNLEDEELLALPFEKIEMAHGDEARAKVDSSLEELRGATTFNEQSLDELTDPVVFTRVYDYFYPAAGPTGAAQPRGQAPTDSPAQSARDDDERRMQTDQDTIARTERDALTDEQHRMQEQEQQRLAAQQGVATDETDERRQERMAGTSQQDQQHQRGEEQPGTAGQYGTAGEDRARTVTGGQSERRPHVLVARNVVSMIIPGMTTTKRLEDAPITTAQDEEFGQIEEIVLDIDNDRVAYVLASTGAVLGIGGERVALPLQKLKWSEQSESYTTDVDADQATGQEDIPVSDVPQSISRQKLQQFYGRFNVQPAAYSAQQDRSGTNWRQRQNLGDEAAGQYDQRQQQNLREGATQGERGSAYGKDTDEYGDTGEYGGTDEYGEAGEYGGTDESRRTDEYGEEQGDNRRQDRLEDDPEEGRL